MTMTTTNLPTWLDVDGIASPTDRAKIQACADAAHKVLDAVLEFADNWGEYFQHMNGAAHVDGFSDEVVDAIRWHLGLELVRGPLGLAEGALAVLDGDSPRQYGWVERIESSAHASQQESLRRLIAATKVDDPKAPASGF